MRVEKLLKRLKREFFKVNLIQSSLDSMIFFLALNLGLFLLNIRIINEIIHFPAIGLLTLVVFIADLTHRTKNYKLELYEEKNPQFREILRTARDNIDNQNVVSQAMFDDLMDRARSVKSDSIVPDAEIIEKIMIIGILSFLTALSGIVDYQVQKETQEIFSKLEPKEILKKDQKDLGNSSEIYGEPKEIKISGTELQINITGKASGKSTGELSRISSEEFTYQSSNPGISEDVQLAKRYSLEIRSNNQ